jgi:hypothetical protein
VGVSGSDLYYVLELLFLDSFVLTLLLQLVFYFEQGLASGQDQSALMSTYDVYRPDIFKSLNLNRLLQTVLKPPEDTL